MDTHARDARFVVPILTARKTAMHVGIPRSTVRHWLTTPAGPAPLIHSVPPAAAHGPRVPFIAVAEAQVLAELRKAGLSMRQIRAGVERMRWETGEEYVLASQNIATDGAVLLWNMATKVAPEWVRAKDLQRAFTQVVETVVKFVSYASDGFADRLTLKPYGDAMVIMDPRFAFGEPVLGRSKVRVETIADLYYGAGEPVEDIAEEYDISTVEVEAVIHVLRRRAA